MACAILVLAACAADSSPRAGSCPIVQPPTPLPAGLDESSGIAASRAQPGVFWSQDDSGGEPVLFGVRSNGELVMKLRLDGATNEDWEDIAVGPCPAGSCVYVADTGDNDAERDDAAIYRVAEPRAGGPTHLPAERFGIRYPDGPRDAEAVFVMPNGQPFLVTKGRHGRSVSIYRYPLPLRADSTVEVEHVVDLGSGERHPLDLVTGASASPSGRWIAIRTYRALGIYSADALLGGDTVPAQAVDLDPVGEVQGEAVALLDDGRVALTSEGGVKDAPGTIAIIACTLGG